MANGKGSEVFMKAYAIALKSLHLDPVIKSVNEHLKAAIRDEMSKSRANKRQHRAKVDQPPTTLKEQLALPQPGSPTKPPCNNQKPLSHVQQLQVLLSD